MKCSCAMFMMNIQHRGNKCIYLTFSLLSVSIWHLTIYAINYIISLPQEAYLELLLSLLEETTRLQYSWLSIVLNSCGENGFYYDEKKARKIVVQVTILPNRLPCPLPFHQSQGVDSFENPAFISPGIYGNCCIFSHWRWFHGYHNYYRAIGLLSSTGLTG